MSNDFGGGFDAGDEATKVAAPPLAALNQPIDPNASPVATAGQPTDGIGVRQYTQVRTAYGLGVWSDGNTTQGAGVAMERPHPVQQAGTQAIDSSKALT